MGGILEPGVCKLDWKYPVGMSKVFSALEWDYPFGEGLLGLPGGPSFFPGKSFKP